MILEVMETAGIQWVPVPRMDAKSNPAHEHMASYARQHTDRLRKRSRLRLMQLH